MVAASANPGTNNNTAIPEKKRMCRSRPDRIKRVCGIATTCASRTESGKKIAKKIGEEDRDTHFLAIFRSPDAMELPSRLSGYSDVWAS
jgi:hypothetical protein